LDDLADMSGEGAEVVLVKRLGRMVVVVARELVAATLEA
jgi:hypothetical protein